MRWLGLALVVAAAAAILIVKTSSPPNRSPAPPQRGAPRALLFANPREADDACGCGEIIRAVRAAAARGLVTRVSSPSAPSWVRLRHVISPG